MSALHKRYAPILRFNKGEKFFPMRVDDIFKYSSLYLKGSDKPVVPQGQLKSSHLTKHKGNDVFVRTVNTGPLTGETVVKEWGEDTLEMVLHWANNSAISWTEDFARSAYSWFSPKTKSATQLFWWNGLVKNLIQGAVETASSGQLPRLILPTETEANALERYHKATPAYTYYYRELQDGDYWCLQYWFFYSYNNWGTSFMGLNDHEGDWECILLFFEMDGGQPKSIPAFITYADHESRQSKPWQDVEHIGRHPVVYVGAGSHASYPKASNHTLLEAYNLVDRATGDGEAIDGGEWVHRINLADVPWLGQYQGSWGTRFWLSTAQAKSILQIALSAVTPLASLASMISLPQEIELPGVSAPRGPVGVHREQYANPVAWAGVPPKVSS